MVDSPESHTVRDDTAEQRRARRVERERAMIAEGQAQIDRGEFLEEGELERWLDQLEIDPETPLPPRSGRMR